MKKLALYLKKGWEEDKFIFCVLAPLGSLFIVSMVSLCVSAFILNPSAFLATIGIGALPFILVLWAKTFKENGNE